MAPNVPAAWEATLAVPMLGAVVNTINTRLDAGTGGLHPRARRGEGDHHRPRALTDGGARSREARTAAARHRRRRPGGGGRRAARRGRVRGVPRRRRPGVRLAGTERRMGLDLAQLHLRHHREPQGGGLQPPGGVPQRDDQRGRMGHGPPSGISLDPADVPLQRLVLPLDPRRGRGHRHLPSQGRGEGDIRRDCRRRGHPLLRRARRPQLPPQRAGGGPAAARACGAGHDGGRGAPPRRCSKGWRRAASGSPTSTD